MLRQSILTHQFFQLFSTQTAEYSYRAAVRELLPQLCYLDNLRVEERHPSSVMGEDWIILQNAIKDNKSSGTATEEGLCFKCGLGSLMHTCPGITGCSFFSAEESTDVSCPGSRASSAGHFSSSSFVSNHHSADLRPASGSVAKSTVRPLPPAGPRPASARLRLRGCASETSILTHG